MLQVLIFNRNISSGSPVIYSSFKKCYESVNMNCILVCYHMEQVEVLLCIVPDTRNCCLNSFFLEVRSCSLGVGRGFNSSP